MGNLVAQFPLSFNCLNSPLAHLQMCFADTDTTSRHINDNDFIFSVKTRRTVVYVNDKQRLIITYRMPVMQRQLTLECLAKP